MIFRFRALEIDEECFELRHCGRNVPVQPKVLDVIFFLVRSGGRLVTKDDLIAGPWKGSAVSDGALNQCILLARRALATGGAADAIVTVHSRGFRFRIEGRSGAKPSPTEVGQPPLTFARGASAPRSRRRRLTSGRMTAGRMKG